jgi:DNA-binding transcriptional regulator YdaS (Cro superfamily)
MDAARIQALLALTPNNGWMASARLHAVMTIFAQQIHAVSKTVCAMTTLMIANAITGIISPYLKPNVSVIYGSYGKSMANCKALLDLAVSTFKFR